MTIKFETLAGLKIQGRVVELLPQGRIVVCESVEGKCSKALRKHLMNPRGAIFRHADMIGAR